MSIETHRGHPYAECFRHAPQIEPAWDDLDPGIRETVRLLWRAGFHPRDSGDGVSKRCIAQELAMECAMDVPNVTMVLLDACDLVAECERLHQLMSRLDIEVSPTGQGTVSIQGSYDPANGLGVIMLVGITDAMLVPA